MSSFFKPFLGTTSNVVSMGSYAPSTAAPAPAPAAPSSSSPPPASASTGRGDAHAAEAETGYTAEGLGAESLSVITSQQPSRSQSTSSLLSGNGPSAPASASTAASTTGTGAAGAAGTATATSAAGAGTTAFHGSTSLADRSGSPASTSTPTATTPSPMHIPGLPYMEGTLLKWTNYLHGWQERWVVLGSGILSYFKSQSDVAYGCRGSMNLREAVISVHPFDELRFQVALQDSVYYMKTATNEEREKWIEALETSKTTLIETMSISSTGSIRKKQSAKSLAFAASLKEKSLKERLAEMESYHDILSKQVDQISQYYERVLLFHSQLAEAAAMRAASEVASIPPHPLDEAELREEIITFKATSSGMLSSLDECIQEMTRHDEELVKKYDHELDRRRKVEVELANLRSNVKRPGTQGRLLGPDMEEGPHSALKDDEFFDALEASLDRSDQIMASELAKPIPASAPLGEHRLAAEVRQSCKDGLRLATEDVEKESSWSLVLEEGPMKVWRREVEDASGALMNDRLKAYHYIKGVTAREAADLFFDPDKKAKLEHICEFYKMLEILDSRTYIQQAVYKKVWPAAQRDAVYVAHLEQTGPHSWMTAVFSVDHKDALFDNYCRVTTNASLVCNTVFDPSIDPNTFDMSKLTRDKISCAVTYTACVNPGGWAPIAAVRAISKREYPKFLRKLEQVSNTCYDDKTPIMM